MLIGTSSTSGSSSSRRSRYLTGTLPAYIPEHGDVRFQDPVRMHSAILQVAPAHARCQAGASEAFRGAASGGSLCHPVTGMCCFHQSKACCAIGCYIDQISLGNLLRYFYRAAALHFTRACCAMGPMRVPNVCTACGLLVNHRLTLQFGLPAIVTVMNRRRHLDPARIEVGCARSELLQGTLVPHGGPSGHLGTPQ